MRYTGVHLIQSQLLAAPMPNPVSDDLEGLKRLDAHTVSAIYDRYFPDVYRYVRFRLNDDRQAEDIASDVFVRLLEAARAGRGPETNLKAWLLATASHILTDHLRKSYRRPESELPEDLADEFHSLTINLENKEQARRLKTALSNLTGEQQIVIALRFGQAYSLEETALLMKKNANAIKQLQFRALAALNRFLSEMP